MFPRNIKALGEGTTASFILRFRQLSNIGVPEIVLRRGVEPFLEKLSDDPGDLVSVDNVPLVIVQYI